MSRFNAFEKSIYKKDKICLEIILIKFYNFVKTLIFKFNEINVIDIILLKSFRMHKFTDIILVVKIKKLF